ncbi:MAG: hypothetical protein HUU20_24080, partial [Pirellulales bacterium]|nr:hypothetical protein [Pirellulales bacterium]
MTSERLPQENVLEAAMSAQTSQPTIPLPKHWNDHVRAAMLHVISLAQLACACTRGWAANSTNARIRLTAATDRSQQHAALVAERMRIKDARMARLAPHQRPHYTP